MRRLIAGVMMVAAPVLAQPAWEAVGEGTITDASHPSRPGDFRTFNVRVRVAMDEATGGEASAQSGPWANAGTRRSGPWG